ncbi:MAG: CDP-alcohol phosphatidyltransferase family protein [Clostridia bacterium]|nr:CDP-alcohol phosphatidyltransferase family protein [Clostridia bacterium]
MNKNKDIDYSKKIITIPNILSLFRLMLIPLIAWLYIKKKDYYMTVIVLGLSGLTDVIDGIIARKFNMISDFGKAFDPIADKLTQIIVLFCLVSRFEFMIIPLIILIIKELLAGIIGLLTIKKTHRVHGAVWHGKTTTVLLYIMMTIHIIWYNIPIHISNILILICTAMMLLSAVLYGIKNIGLIKEATQKNA